MVIKCTFFFFNKLWLLPNPLTRYHMQFILFVPASINAKLPPHAEAIEDDPTELEYRRKTVLNPGKKHLKRD